MKTNRPFTPEELTTMAKSYATIERIDPCAQSYKKLVALLDSLPLDALSQLASANIRFVSVLASNRVRRLTP